MESSSGIPASTDFTAERVAARIKRCAPYVSFGWGALKAMRHYHMLRTDAQKFRRYSIRSSVIAAAVVGLSAFIRNQELDKTGMAPLEPNQRPVFETFPEHKRISPAGLAVTMGMIAACAVGDQVLVGDRETTSHKRTALIVATGPIAGTIISNTVFA